MVNSLVYHRVGYRNSNKIDMAKFVQPARGRQIYLFSCVAQIYLNRNTHGGASLLRFATDVLDSYRVKVAFGGLSAESDMMELRLVA